MNLWILDCKDGSTPPGTSQLLEPRPKDVIEHLTASKDTSKVVLEPTPTKDPDDPLNWPYWQRNAALAILCVASFAGNAGAAVLGPAFVQLSTEFHIDFTKVAYLPAWRELAMGIASAVVVPFASIWGKRHQYLLGILLVFIGYIWNGQSSSYGDFLGCQIIQGIGQAPFQALLGLSVGDLYHVHQRGSRLAITTAVTFASGFASPILAGVVVDKLGWRWVFNILAIMSGPALVLVILFVPETAYLRRKRLLSCAKGDGCRLDISRDGEFKFEHSLNTLEVECVPRARMSFAKRLWPTQKRIWSNENLILLLLRPFILVLSPPTLWFLLNTCTPLVSIYATAVVIAISFPSPPLTFNPTQIGLMNLSGCVGSLVGLFICILFSDRVAKLLAKVNNGTYEPEFRLTLVIPQLVIGFFGVYGFGVTASDTQKYGWFWPAFYEALEVANMVIATMVGSAYIIDGYRNVATENFIIFTVTKCLFMFFAASSAVGWVEQVGIRSLFTIIAFIQMGFCLTTIPLYVFGKRIRSRCSKMNICQGSTF